MNPHTRLLAITLFVTLFFGAACADDPARSGPGENSDPGDAGADVGADTDPTDGGSDTGADGGDDSGADGDNIVPKTFGEPCQSNRGCESGYCISSATGFICTQDCGDDSDCPLLGGAPMECRVSENFGADGVRICAPGDSSICAPCFQDSNCFGGACVQGPFGGVCGLDCGSGNSCPAGTVCNLLDANGEPLETPQCLPENNSCGCTAENEGETRPCVRSDNDGRSCFGTETCDPDQGWVGCDAEFPDDEVCDGVDNDCNGAVDDGLPQTQSCENENEFGACQGFAICEAEAGFVCRAPLPAAETCDLVDNDCDGETDEDFKDDAGLLVSTEHCGVCNNNCDNRFDLAAETACVVNADTPECIITECQPGFLLVGTTTCLPLASRLCQPCTDDAACSPEVGDQCVTYPDDSGFCGRSCADDSPFGTGCPDGYVCNADQQCQLATGTCLCGPGDNFLRSCAIPDPNDPGNNCVGMLACTDGVLGDCMPPDDECNGFDDDCDGTIDNDFVDGSGNYTSDTHCGRCFNDCTTLFADPMFHADGVCSGGADPVCALDCDTGFVDVNGTTVDGCECQIIDPSADDPDVNGVDANCDGIDGEVPRGWFVSRTGDDANDGTIDMPLRNIQTAIDRAGGARNHVYVAAGVYDESITLSDGVSVFGGYSSDFRIRDIGGNETAIFGLDPGGTVTARDVTGAVTILAGFTIVGANNNSPSGNSYAIYIEDSDSALTIRNNVIRAGNGGNGERGGSGSPGTDAPDNATAGAVERTSASSNCSNGNPANQSPGGDGGSFSCTNQAGTSISTDGGGGGTANCPNYNQAEQSGFDGDTPPASGDGGNGGYNQRLVFSLGCACLIPDVNGSTEVGVPGEDGSDGSAGNAGLGCASSTGRVVGGEWVAGPARGNPNQVNQPNNGIGGDGFKGDPGGGGGGGGAGSGVEHGNNNSCNNAFDEVIGGGGGGGGAGGCGGTGGSGGSPGGGSFGVFLSFNGAPATLPVINDNVIERGFAGSGGDGGEGAEGGDGALGKIGNALSEAQRTGLLACADPGGRGGDGGDGGAGGGGGGGCGGIAAGIYVWQGGGSGNYATSNTFPPTGNPGLGGVGGTSFGNNGGNGAAGAYTEVVP